MRLLIVTNLYPPQELGGYGRSMADLLKDCSNVAIMLKF